MAEILTRAHSNGNIPRDAIKTNVHPRDSLCITNIGASVTRMMMAGAQCGEGEGEGIPACGSRADANPWHAGTPGPYDSVKPAR